MSKKRYVVPEGMLKEFYVGYNEPEPAECVTSEWSPALAGLEAAIRWQSENPVVPSDEWVLEAMCKARSTSSTLDSAKQMFVEWQRRMYLAPEAPRFMECDACRAKPGLPPLCAGCLHNRDLIKAYGQRYTSEFKPVKDCGYCIVGCSVNGRCPIHGDRP